jgi:two-component system sensor histidine kinase KdpD
VICGATLINWLGRGHLAIIDQAMVYLLGVVIVGSRFRQGPALAASLLSIALFDVFSVPPYFTFAVTDARYVLTFGVMLVIALVMGRLTTRVRGQAEAAREREERTGALYAMTRELAAARNEVTLREIIGRHVGNTFGGDALVLLADQDRRLQIPPSVGLQAAGLEAAGLEAKELGAAQWTYDHNEMAGQGTTTLPAVAGLYVPLAASERTIGVLRLRPADPGQFRDPVRRQLLETFAGQAAVALERALLAERNQRTQVEVEAERLRTALLSSLSHDLRTPLGSIEGAASSLVADGAVLPPALRRELAETIVEESQRMTRLIANLLNMVRLESGALQVQKEWQPLEEVVGIALLRLDERLGGRAVTVSLPADLPAVPIDGLLIEQVLINLLENALKYTPPGSPVDISAAAASGAVMVEVADRGPGIPPGQEEQIFDKFHRVPVAGAGTGIGLGLAICRGIVAAHGGRIWATHRPGGGTAIRFTLPLTGLPPIAAPNELPAA